jgi:hypothetical protein
MSISILVVDPGILLALAKVRFGQPGTLVGAPTAGPEHASPSHDGGGAA